MLEPWCVNDLVCAIIKCKEVMELHLYSDAEGVSSMFLNVHEVYAPPGVRKGEVQNKSKHVSPQAVVLFQMGQFFSYQMRRIEEQWRSSNQAAAHGSGRQALERYL